MTTLVLAAHPDDEVLGCGGYIQHLRAAGERVVVSFLTDGVSARGATALDIVRREKHMQAAGRVLDYEWDQLPSEAEDNEADGVTRLELAQAITGALTAFRPERLLIHSAADLNIDHRRLHEAALIAARPVPGCCVREILAFEVASSTEWGLRSFAPTLFVDISARLETKLEALACYADELRAFPHPRSAVAVRCLAMLRGAAVGVDAAEGYEVIRCVR